MAPATRHLGARAWKTPLEKHGLTEVFPKRCNSLLVHKCNSPPANVRGRFSPAWPGGNAQSHAEAKPPPTALQPAETLPTQPPLVQLPAKERPHSPSFSMLSPRGQRASAALLREVLGPKFPATHRRRLRWNASGVVTIHAGMGRVLPALASCEHRPACQRPTEPGSGRKSHVSTC